MKIFADEIRNLIAEAFPAVDLNQRDMKITLRLFGWDGQTSCSLQQAGDEFGLTRERVRQISKAIAVGLAPYAHKHLTTLPGLIQAISSLAPSSARRVEQILNTQGLAGTRIEGVLKAASLFGMPVKDVKVVEECQSSRFLITPGMEGIAQKISANAQKACTHLGMVHIDSLLYLLPDLTEAEARSFIRDVMSERPDVAWLDDEHNWVWLKAAPRNRLITVLHKMLSVFSSTTIESVVIGANRYFVKGKSKAIITAPSSVLRAFVNAWGQATCSEEGRIRKTASFKSKAKLLLFEKSLVDLIWDTPEKIAREKYLEKSLVPGVNNPKKYTFSMNLNHSPLLTKGDKRGEYITTGFV